MSKSEGLQAIEKPLASLPGTVRNLILDHFHTLTKYEPVIGIMGKTGAVTCSPLINTPRC